MNRSLAGHWPRALWILILAAFLVRALALLGALGIRCLADECFYTDLATQLAAGEGFKPHARHFWPPGYIAYLAAHIKLGLGTEGAKFTQLLLSTLLVPLVWGLGRRAARPWGESHAGRVGLLAAGLIAFNPTLIAYSHYLWTETLFLPLFVGGLILTLDAGEKGSARDAAVAGILFGLARLVKVLPVYLVPLLAGLMVVQGDSIRRLLKAAAVLIGAMFLVILPWSVRNTKAHGQFVLIETTTGKNLVRGNNSIAPSNWDWGLLRQTRGIIRMAGCNQADPVALNACLSRWAVQEIVAHPGRFIAQSVTKVADMVNPTSFLIRHIRRNIYGHWPVVLAHASVVLVAAINMLLMALACLGWIHAPPGPARVMTTVVVLYVFAVHIATFAMSRFRLPLEPLLAVGTALVLSGPPGRLDLRKGAKRWLGVLLLFALLTCWSVRVGALFYEPPPRAEEESLPAPGPSDDE